MLNYDFVCKIFFRIFFTFLYTTLLGKFSQKLTFSKSSWNCLIVSKSKVLSKYHNIRILWSKWRDWSKSHYLALIFFIIFLEVKYLKYNSWLKIFQVYRDNIIYDKFIKKNVKSWFLFLQNFFQNFFTFLYTTLLGKFSQKLTFSKSSWNCLIVK